MFYEHPGEQCEKCARNLPLRVLAAAVAQREMTITFPGLSGSMDELLEGESWNMLREIKSVLETDGLTDFRCVEEIVRIFEQRGLTCGDRHDF